MKDRAVPAWHLQMAQKKTSFLCCVCEEMLRGVRGDVGPEPAHRISRGVIRQRPAISIQHKTSSWEVNSQSAYSHHINSMDVLQNVSCKSSFICQLMTPILWQRTVQCVVTERACNPPNQAVAIITPRNRSSILTYQYYTHLITRHAKETLLCMFMHHREEMR